MTTQEDFLMFFYERKFVLLSFCCLCIGWSIFTSSKLCKFIETSTSSKFFVGGMIDPCRSSCDVVVSTEFEFFFRTFFTTFYILDIIKCATEVFLLVTTVDTVVATIHCDIFFCQTLCKFLFGWVSCHTSCHNKCYCQKATKKKLFHRKNILINNHEHTYITQYLQVQSETLTLSDFVLYFFI